jgi:hypothetical protein
MNCASSGFGIIGRTFPARTEDTNANAALASPNVLHTIGGRWRLILATTLFALAAWHFGHSAYINVTSKLVQYLTASAWQ